MDLFDAEPTLQPIPVEDGELAFLPQLPLALPNDEVLRRLLDETAWRQESIILYGKPVLQPRLSAWYGEAVYTYSGRTFQPLPFTPLQLAIKQAVEAATGRRFNSVLLNCYRDERDSMGFHSDDERELGREPAIASVTFGATRTFILKHKTLPKTLKLDLTDGSLLLMAGTLQQHWRHGINKETKPRGVRVNLTFRLIA
ncbi:alkylated DNA repair dioxygenase AlkB [Pseudoduganella flava]|uniref:Alkylated DNA repair dioxygenase AlkB n=1 Tax=Pseudoduganella flava TaxID=871742 RepID=A0A562PPF4_9BURK|nr:alpha-ketoglutarate-dependent dioxygenase AlkB [Pseudoduganella flava]QGZ40503.1 alpha-ketoglutarate-dependent dioxygenase AlkB [Pseudoduganella flava]TWI45946.1 alkylated DNA repair dioxygenase AlkB [Pseudoduganella flava]